ncbi:hypothetical protein V6U90_24705 [Micromonospora sp. CPCC 206060]|uniref:hypothetical protein n=1 Tax=Micromonospora sp. CPCC 206060 TaxID=3122406 RepID=UPI002FF1EBBD
MDLASLVAALGRESRLVIESSDGLVNDVLKFAKKQIERNDAYRYGKPPTPVSVPEPLLTSPAEVLHELGVATTFLGASPLAHVARHWAHVRYCATLTHIRGHLALARPAEDVVYHHKVTQSEQIGVGLALVVAKAVLRKLHPGWVFNAVDAEMALKAGFVAGIGDVESAHHTKKRPDYFLVGHRTTGRRTAFKIVVLECKGTHKARAYAVEQLARASVQVEALTVGGRTPPSLMVASCLARRGITSYVLDPPGDDELWSGQNRDMDELLRGDPEDQLWRPRPGTPTADESSTTTSAGRRTPGSTNDPDDLAPGAPDIFEIPEERRGWFTQILTRAVAATTLLFAGNSAAARGYATPRQRGEEDSTGQLALPELDPPWASNTATSIRLSNGLNLVGTHYRTPLPDGNVLEVFRGVERRLYRHLADGEIGTYLRAAPRTHQKWSQKTRPDDAVLSLGRDGTALVLRISRERRRRQ